MEFFGEQQRLRGVITTDGEVIHPHETTESASYVRYARKICFKSDKDNSRYDGSWKGGREHGEGTKIWPNDDRYHGQWENGLRSGRGMFVSAVDGHTYVGEWKADKKDGDGTIEYASGDRYVGKCVNGVRQVRKTPSLPPPRRALCFRAVAGYANGGGRAAWCSSDNRPTHPAAASHQRAGVVV